MALGAVRVGTASTGSTTPRSPSLPASVASGELLLLCVAIEGASCSVTTPTGYTLEANAANGTTLRSYIFSKIAGGSESAPSVTSSGTSRMQIFAIPGPAATPVSANNTGSGSSTSAAVPTLSSPGVRGAMLVQSVASSVAGTAITSDWRMRLAGEGNSGGTTAAHCRGAIAYEAGMSEDAPTPSARTMTVGSGTWASAAVWVVPASAATFGLRQSAKANSTGTAINTLTATLPDNGVSGSLLTAEVADYYWFTFGYVDDVDYNGGLNFTKIVERSTSGSDALVSLWCYPNNAQTASAPAVVARQNAGADTASMSLIAKEWLGADTSATPYEAEASAVGTGTTATVTTGTMTSGQRLVVSMVTVVVNASAYAGDSDYTVRWIQPTGTSNWLPALSQDREMAGGGTDTVTATWVTSGSWAIAVTAFKPAASAPLPPYPHRVIRYAHR